MPSYTSSMLLHRMSKDSWRVTKLGKTQLTFIGQVLHLALVSCNPHNRTRMLVVLFPHFIKNLISENHSIGIKQIQTQVCLISNCVFQSTLSDFFPKPSSYGREWQWPVLCRQQSFFLQTAFSILAHLLLLLHPCLPHIGILSFPLLPAPISTSHSINLYAQLSPFSLERNGWTAALADSERKLIFCFSTIRTWS